MRALLALIVLSLAATIAPATASAATWKGKTKQGRAVVVHTDSDRRVDRVRIGWRARCGSGAYTSQTLFRAPLDTAKATAFAHDGDYRARPSGYRARIWVHIAGSLDNRVWRGRFRVRVRVKKDGKVVDTCRLKRLRWRAARV
jgi:hypothetical protein